MNLKSDEELVHEISQGDIHAFEILVRRYQGKLLGFVTHLLGDRYAAEEVVQDAFMNVYKTIDRIDTSRTFSSYMFVITRNTAYSFVRRSKQALPLDEDVEGVDETIYEKLVTTDKEIEVRSAIGKLKRKYARVMTLYYFDDLSYEEISRKLKLPINTVRTHLKRAKEQLKSLLSYENH